MKPNSKLPFTLRQLGGAPLTPPPISESALVVIDAQREYLDGLVPLPAIGPALNQIAKLLRSARQAGQPVIHVVHIGKPGGDFDPEVGGRIIDHVKPIQGERIVSKALPNAFADTDLRQILTSLGDPHLIICGFMTHMCVSSTGRSALDHGLGITVVADATATRDLPTTDGNGVMPHDQLHQASLAALADRFGFVASTSDLVV